MMGKSRKNSKGIGEVGSKRSGKKRFERVERVFADEKREEAGTAARGGLEKAFDAISDWVCLVDTKSHILRSNSAGERFTGLGTEEMVGQLCCKLVHGSDKPIAGCPLKKMLKTGRRESVGLQVPGIDRWLMVTVDPVKDGKGKVTSTVHIVRDITKEKRAEGKLAAERNLLRTLIDNMPDEIYVKDTDSRFILCNRTVAEHHGVSSPDELIGKTDFDLYPGKVAERYCAEEQQIMCSGEPKVNCFEIYLDSKGNEVWGLNTRMPLRDSEGRIIGIVGIGRDVAQEKKAEKALIEERNLLRTVIGNIPDRIYVKDTESRFVLCNEAVVRREGQSSADDVVGKTDFDFYPRDLAEQFLAEERRVIESGEPLINREGVSRDAADEEFCVLTTKVPLRDSEGRIAGIVGIDRDITERKRAETALEREREQMDTILSSLNTGLSLIDADMRIKWVNSKIRKMFACGEPVGQLCHKFYEGRDEPCEPCATIRVLKTGQTAEVERYNPQDGCWYHIVSQPIKDESGRVVHVLEAVMDITERKRAEEELQRSEAFLNATGRMAKVGGWELDAITKEVRWTEETYCIHEVPLDYKPSLDEAINFYHSEDRPKLASAIQRALECGEPYDMEIRFITAKGRHLWTHTTCTPHVKNGKTVRLTGTFQDVTERKRAEEAVVRERNLLRTLIDNMPDLIYVKDVDNRFILCNPVCAKRAGVETAEEMIGKTDFDLYPEDAEHFSAEEQQIIRMGEPLLNHEEFGIDKAGNGIWGLTSKVPLRDIDGRITGIVGICHDITERKAMEEALAKEHNLLRTLIDSIPDEIYVKDTASQFILCNETVARYRGADTPEQLVGKTDFDLYPEDEAARYYAEEQEVLRSGESVANRKEYGVDAEGNEICGLTTKMPLWDSSGGIVGLLGISRDITEEEKAEQKLIEYQRQLKSLASQLTLAEERERRRIAGELHDTVSQSLALAKIKLDALRAGTTAREPNEVLAEVSASLDKTIQDTRSLTFDLSYPILYELGFEAAVEEWLEENVGHRYGIKTEFYDDGSEKLLDDDVRVLLFRNVRELLANVVKHSNAKKVKVSVRKIDDEIQVAVEDNGVGFDVERQAATAGRRSEYGLMSIRERLEDIGGNFDIESSPGGGCTATMTVPVNNEQIEAGG